MNAIAPAEVIEWACAFAKDNVRVNAIAPAEVMTPLYEKWLQNFPNPDKQYKAIAFKIPYLKQEKRKHIILGCDMLSDARLF